MEVSDYEIAYRNVIRGQENEVSWTSETMVVLELHTPSSGDSPEILGVFGAGTHTVSLRAEQIVATGTYTLVLRGPTPALEHEPPPLTRTFDVVGRGGLRLLTVLSMVSGIALILSLWSLIGPDTVLESDPVLHTLKIVWAVMSTATGFVAIPALVTFIGSWSSRPPRHEYFDLAAPILVGGGPRFLAYLILCAPLVGSIWGSYYFVRFEVTKDIEPAVRVVDGDETRLVVDCSGCQVTMRRSTFEDIRAGEVEVMPYGVTGFDRCARGIVSTLSLTCRPTIEVRLPGIADGQLVEQQVLGDLVYENQYVPLRTVLVPGSDWTTLVERVHSASCAPLPREIEINIEHPAYGSNTWTPTGLEMQIVPGDADSVLPSSTIRLDYGLTRIEFSNDFRGGDEPVDISLVAGPPEAPLWKSHQLCSPAKTESAEPFACELLYPHRPDTQLTIAISDHERVMTFEARTSDLDLSAFTVFGIRLCAEGLTERSALEVHSKTVASSGDSDVFWPRKIRKKVREGSSDLRLLYRTLETRIGDEDVANALVGEVLFFPEDDYVALSFYPYYRDPSDRGPGDRLEGIVKLEPSASKLDVWPEMGPDICHASFVTEDLGEAEGKWSAQVPSGLREHQWWTVELARGRAALECELVIGPNDNNQLLCEEG